jgi:nicotinate phosphoribosyltransferase
MKLSEQAIKVSNPGIQQVRRFTKAGEFAGDMIFDEENLPQTDTFTMIDPADMTRQKTFDSSFSYEDLLINVFDKGKATYQSPTIEQIRERVKTQLKGFHNGIKRFVNPHSYPVGLEENLFQLKNKLLLQLRKK